jgi:RimJ/RimL family protein N-acetyltransferase
VPVPEASGATAPLGVTPVLETARLLLRPVRLSDAEPMFEEYASDPAVTRFLLWRPQTSVEGVRDFLCGALERAAAGAEAHWVLTRRGEDRPLGAIGCVGQGFRAELGYVLGRAYWNRGYMSEALGAVVAWSLALGSLHRVWAVCDVENLASARVLEKSGMSREGLLRRWSFHPNVSDVPRDCYVYSAIRHASASG